MLLRDISLTLNNDHELTEKDLFFNCFLSLSKFFDLAAKLLLSSSTSFNYKCPSCISLKKTIGK